MKSLVAITTLALFLLAPGGARAARYSVTAEGFGFLSVVEGQPLVLQFAGQEHPRRALHIMQPPPPQPPGGARSVQQLQMA